MEEVSTGELSQKMDQLQLQIDKHMDVLMDQIMLRVDHHMQKWDDKFKQSEQVLSYLQNSRREEVDTTCIQKVIDIDIYDPSSGYSTSESFMEPFYPNPNLGLPFRFVPVPSFCLSHPTIDFITDPDLRPKFPYERVMDKSIFARSDRSPKLKNSERVIATANRINYRGVYSKIAPSIVSVSTYIGSTKLMDCSGLIVEWNSTENEATVLTSTKVIATCFEHLLVMADGTSFVGRVDDVDTYNDILSLKVESTAELKAVDLRSKETNFFEGINIISLSRLFYTSFSLIDNIGDIEYPLSFSIYSHNVDSTSLDKWRDIHSKIAPSVVSVASFYGGKKVLDCSGLIIDWSSRENEATVLTSAKPSRIRFEHLIVRIADGTSLLATQDYEDSYHNILILKVKSMTELKAVDLRSNPVDIVARAKVAMTKVIAMGRMFYTCSLVGNLEELYLESPLIGCDERFSKELLRTTCRMPMICEGGPLVTATANVVGMNVVGIDFNNDCVCAHLLPTPVIINCLETKVEGDLWIKVPGDHLIESAVDQLIDVL